MYTWKITVCIALALKTNLYSDWIDNEHQEKYYTQDLGHAICPNL